MKTLIVLSSLALALPAVAAQPPPPPPPPDQDAQPQGTPPDSEPPPPPPVAPPIAQPIEAPPTATAAPPAPDVSGEWVYTAQYGWIWVPYAQTYTHVIENSGVAYEFVYYPRFGWRWVLAPWVFSLGPRPYFVHGPVRFAWYAHPWFRAHPLVRRRVVREHRH
jgi:hypothetical protein